MNNGNGVSRGDRNRNARLARLRELVPVVNAVVGIDLADKKQMVVVTDHDSRVLARRTFRCRAWDLGVALDWAAERAAVKGFAGVTVACEPTGHRWRVLGLLAADRGMPFVCVQPMLTSWARRSEDLTRDKTDEKDAVLDPLPGAGLVAEELHGAEPVGLRRGRVPAPHVRPGPGRATPGSGRSARCHLVAGARLGLAAGPPRARGRRLRLGRRCRCRRRRCGPAAVGLGRVGTGGWCR
jgi:hypothetical protein